MPQCPAHARLAAAVLLLLTAPAAAQKLLPPPGDMNQPGMDQPGMDQAPRQQDGRVLAGGWTGERMDQTGGMRVSEYYGPDGSYVAAGQLANGLAFRGWGQYRVSVAGPRRLQVDIQLQGYLPQQMCGQAPGMPMRCTPFQLPSSASVMLTFTSTDAFQAISLTSPEGGPITMMRDANPVLLQRPVPAQAMINLPAPPPPAYTPVPAPGGIVNCAPLGATRCVSGWLHRCEPVGTGTMWKTGATHC